MILWQAKFSSTMFPFPNTTFPNIVKVSPWSVRSRRTPSNASTLNSRLYQGTIKFNIMLGANRDVTDEEIDNAAKDANVLSLPFYINVRYTTSSRVFHPAMKRSLAPKALLYQEVKNSELLSQEP